MISSNTAVDLIVLAAGASKRLGRPKQLLQYEGKNLLQRTIDLSKRVDFHCRILVLGANADNISKEVSKETLDTVINHDWEEGLASSIRCGLSKLLEINPESENVMFLLCDQPLLNSEILVQMLKVHQSNRGGITLCEYDGQWGVPMIFNRKFFGELTKLKGTAGAKKVALKHPDLVCSLEFENGKFDIDTEDDYRRLNERV